MRYHAKMLPRQSPVEDPHDIHNPDLAQTYAVAQGRGRINYPLSRSHFMQAHGWTPGPPAAPPSAPENYTCVRVGGGGIFLIRWWPPGVLTTDREDIDPIGPRGSARLVTAT
jgi:hypothetical protein